MLKSRGTENGGTENKATRTKSVGLVKDNQLNLEREAKGISPLLVLYTKLAYNKHSCNSELEK